MKSGMKTFCLLKLLKNIVN